MNNTHGEALLLVKLQALKVIRKLKVTVLHGCFSRFLNCTNGNKSRNASHLLSHCLFIKFKWLIGALYWERWFSSIQVELRVFLTIKNHSKKANVLILFVSWLQFITRMHEKSSVFHTVQLMQHSYDFIMIFIRIENCTLSIGILSFKHEVTAENRKVLLVTKFSLF